MDSKTKESTERMIDFLYTTYQSPIKEMIRNAADHMKEGTIKIFSTYIVTHGPGNPIMADKAIALMRYMIEEPENPIEESECNADKTMSKEITPMINCLESLMEVEKKRSGHGHSMN